MKKITDLPQLTIPSGSDVLVIVDVDTDTTKYITRQDLLRDAIDTIDIKNDAVTPDKLSAIYAAANAASTTGVIASSTFASTNLQLTLPSAGVWVVNVSVRCSTGIANSWLELRLYNSTTGVDADSILGHSDFISGLTSEPNLQPTSSKQIICITTTANNIIQLQARKGSGDMTVVSDDNGRTGMVAFRIA